MPRLPDIAVMLFGGASGAVFAQGGVAKSTSSLYTTMGRMACGYQTPSHEAVIYADLGTASTRHGVASRYHGVAYFAVVCKRPP